MFTFAAMALLLPSGLAPAPMNMQVHRQKFRVKSGDYEPISSYTSAALEAATPEPGATSELFG